MEDTWRIEGIRYGYGAVLRAVADRRGRGAEGGRTAEGRKEGGRSPDGGISPVTGCNYDR